MRHSNSKNLPYYFNSVDKVSRWEPPAGTDTEKLKLYMATHHSAARAAAGGGGAVVDQSAAAPAGKIRAAHLLVKHRDSRRPASWREVSVFWGCPLLRRDWRGHGAMGSEGDCCPAVPHFVVGFLFPFFSSWDFSRHTAG